MPHFNDAEEHEVPTVRIPYVDIANESANGLNLLILFDGEECWLPKSQCDFSEDGILIIPQWLAEKEDLEELVE